VTNPECPDYMAHEQNAADRYFESVPFSQRPAVLTRDQSEAIDALAEAEYLTCEGH
jgi:hypothetical protein